MTGRRRRPVVVLAEALLVAAMAAALVASCTTDDRWRATALAAERLRQPDAFYEWSAADLAGEPGTLVRSERIIGAPAGARAWRVLFRSRDVADRPVVVSGVVLAPDGATAVDRPVVSWGHPTTGAARTCAPSLGVDPFDTIEGATDLLSAGYVVVASDYPGMGARGPSAYLIGVSEGRSMIDAARAAAELPATRAGGEVVLWGHSQGGHAALFAARAAPTYAPDLDVAAVAVAAPAVELGQLLDDDIGDSAGVALGSYAFAAYADAFGDAPDPPQLDQILTPAGVRATPEMAGLCLFGQHVALHRIADPLVGRYLARSPSDVEPWRTLLRENTPTAVPYGMPVFVAQGERDTLVRPATTASYVRALCEAGQPVEFHRIPKGTHLTVAVDSMPEVIGFFDRARAGAAVGDSC